MLALRWRTVTASDHPLLILLRSNNWCLNIYILMNYHNGISAEGDLTNEVKNDWSRDIVWDGFLELNWWQHHILGDKVTVSVISTSKQSLYEVWQLDQTVVIDGAEEYRVEPGSGRNAGDQTNIFLVDGGRRSKLKSWRVHVKDRFQVAICEPVWVDDDGDIFGRQRTNGTDRIVR